jgi:hypothetical protein
MASSVSPLPGPPSTSFLFSLARLGYFRGESTKMPFPCTHLVSLALSLLRSVLGADPGALHPTSCDHPEADSRAPRFNLLLSLIITQSRIMAKRMPRSRSLSPKCHDAALQSRCTFLPIQPPFRGPQLPFVCLADALEIIISLIIHVVRGKSLRQAALLVNWQRARHRLGEDVEELEEVPAEKHPWGFVILLVAAVLQAAKIIGFRGVFWTKVWAVVYLLSYVVISVVGFLAPKDWRDSPPEIVSRRRSYWNFETLSQVLPLGAHFVCCSWILDRIIVGDSATHQIPFL